MSTDTTTEVKLNTRKYGSYIFLYLFTNITEKWIPILYKHGDYLHKENTTAEIRKYLSIEYRYNVCGKNKKEILKYMAEVGELRPEDYLYALLWNPCD